MADSKSNVFENDVLKLVFNATPIPDLADNDATSPCTNLSVALHTADPGETGDQTTSEIAYTGYGRVNVPRTTGGWTVTGNSVSPVANIDFGVMTAGAGGTVMYFSVGTGAANKMLYRGTVTPNINVVNGVLPRLTTATAIIEQ
jgi:hypothetical protein